MSRKHTGTWTLVAFLMGALSATATAGAVTVTVDQAVRYQAIEGFGASFANDLGPHNDAAFLDRIVNDLGISIMRLHMMPDFEPTNDDNDTLTRGTFRTDGIIGLQLQILAKAQQAGLQKIVLNTFSPPAWMKTNGSVIAGALRTDMYGEFTEYCAEYVRLVENTGLSVYALSPQNEPAFEEWYNSCVYTPAELRDIIIHIGRRLQTEGHGAKIFWSEQLFTLDWQSYAGHVFASPEARPFGSIVAIHHQGVSISDSSRYTAGRALIETAGSSPYSLGFWNSELSGYQNGWDGAMTMAEGFMVSLGYGKMSCLLFGSVTMPSSWNQDAEALMVDKIPTERYYVAKQFYRYIRPGAVMVGATTSDPDVMAVGFVHDDDHTMTLVLVNRGTAQKSVSLQGGTFSEFTQIRTSAAETCDTVGTVSSTVSLPPRSVTTLFAEDYHSAIAHAHQSDCAVRRQAPSTSGLISLDGRYRTSTGSAAGLCVVKNLETGDRTILQGALRVQLGEVSVSR